MIVEITEAQRQNVLMLIKLGWKSGIIKSEEDAGAMQHLRVIFEKCGEKTGDPKQAQTGPVSDLPQ
jgi:hypothetical protein